MARPIPLGMCINPDKVADLAPGYDYLELTVSGTLNPLEDDVAMAPSVLPLRSLQPPVRAFNVFVASSVRLTGPEVDWDRVRTYVDRAAPGAQRAQQIVWLRRRATSPRGSTASRLSQPVQFAPSAPTACRAPASPWLSSR